MPGKLIVDEIEDSGGNSVIVRKNLIINGGMKIAQRGTSFVSPSSTDYTLDRWQNTYNQDTGATTIAQSAGTPSFFGNSLKVDCTTAEATVDAGNYWLLRQSLEGQDLQHLGYGGSTAKTITISFWVNSTKTGTFAVSLYNDDAAKSYVADVTVDSASTWEKKTVTIAGDTASGFNNDNGRSLILNITLNAGSTFQTTAGSWTSGAYFGTSSTDNFLDNTANEFFITGVQMEVGSVATDFEFRPVAEEQNLCDRYFQSYGGEEPSGFETMAAGLAVTTTQFRGYMAFRCKMRDVPSSTATGDFEANGQDTVGTNTENIIRQGTSQGEFNATFDSARTVGRSYNVRTKSDTSARFQLDAEL